MKQRARGGRINPVSYWGMEHGPEKIIKGYVIDAKTTRKLLGIKEQEMRWRVRLGNKWLDYCSVIVESGRRNRVRCWKEKKPIREWLWLRLFVFGYWLMKLVPTGWG